MSLKQRNLVLISGVHENVSPRKVPTHKVRGGHFNEFFLHDERTCRPIGPPVEVRGQRILGNSQTKRILFLNRNQI